MKVSKANQNQLNWMVAKALDYEVDTEGAYNPETGKVEVYRLHGATVPGRYRGSSEWNPCGDWEQANWILDDMRKTGLVNLTLAEESSQCMYRYTTQMLIEDDSSVLVAICRCYVRSKLGAHVSVPEEL